MKMKKSYFKHPLRILLTKVLSEFFKTQLYRDLVVNNPKRAINLQWLYNYGKLFPWKTPKTLDEKIQWLSALTDTNMWTLCADKYEVRQFVERKGYGDILIKNFGVWDKVEDIDYDLLPNKFVIKCTHDTGSTYVVEKGKTNLTEINEKLKKQIETPFGYISCEPHYLKIKPRIVAEDYLEETTDISSSLIDYKIWCLNGKAYFGFICYDRHRETNGHIAVTYDVYRLDSWKPWRECLSKKYSCQNFKDIPEPKNLKKMISIAEDLAIGFPEVRVDFYNIDGSIYFGEMTFTSMCGRNEFYSDETLLKMGDAIDLSTIKTIR